MPTPPLSDELAQQAVEAVREHGTVTKAALALGIPRATLDHRVRMAARAGMAFETYRVFERGGRISFDRFLRILDVLGLLDQVELVPPTPFTSIDEVVNQGSARPRQRVRSPKRQHNYEVPR